MASKPTHDNRTRFNWGYHDGAHNFRMGFHVNRNGICKIDESHFDQVYVAGIRAGWSAARDGESTESSESAWKQSGIPSGSSHRPHRLTGRDSKGRKIAPWMVA